jgi:hypothetical protein
MRIHLDAAQFSIERRFDGDVLSHEPAQQSRHVGQQMILNPAVATAKTGHGPQP